MIETSNDNEINILPNSTKLTKVPLEQQANATNLDPNLFTFKPHINPKSALLTQNLINFYERQNQHIRKQTDMVSFDFIYFCRNSVLVLFFVFINI
jgi:hypothetical protein